MIEIAAIAAARRKLVSVKSETLLSARILTFRRNRMSHVSSLLSSYSSSESARARAWCGEAAAVAADDADGGGMS